MSTRPEYYLGHSEMVIKDRRAGPDAKGATRYLRRLQGLLVRPLAFQRQDGKIRLVLVDRRRARDVEQLPSLAELRAELRERLLAQDEHAADVMRHLVFVHDLLGRSGWAGVDSLPASVLRKALVQAEMLASEDPAPEMTMIIDHLRLAKVAAEVREEHASRPDEGDKRDAVEISEIPHDEFEALARADNDRPLGRAAPSPPPAGA